jgi:hypothetical protein
MKKVLLLLTAVASLISANYASAFGPWAGGNYTGVSDLGSTPAQLIARYGTPVSVEKGWYGAGNSYGFFTDKSKTMFLYATTTPDGSKVEDVIFQASKNGKNVAATKAQKFHLLLVNSDPHIEYYSDEFGVMAQDWDGTDDWPNYKGYKHVGVKADINWTHCIFVTDTETGGYQLRTKKQFDLEQPYVKAKFFVKK